MTRRLRGAEDAAKSAAEAAAKWAEAIRDRPASAVPAWSTSTGTTSPPIKLDCIVVGSPGYEALMEHSVLAAKSDREDVADYGRRVLALDEQQRQALDAGDDVLATSAAIRLGAKVQEWQDKDKGEPYYKNGKLSAGQGEHGKKGGAPPLIDAPDRYDAVEKRLGAVSAATGERRRRLAEEVAERDGVKIDSVLRAARRHRLRRSQE